MKNEKDIAVMKLNKGKMFWASLLSNAWTCLLRSGQLFLLEFAVSAYMEWQTLMLMWVIFYFSFLRSNLHGKWHEPTMSFI